MHEPLLERIEQLEALNNGQRPSEPTMTTQPAAPTTAAPALPRMFLRAGWYHLAMLNYPADPVILQPYVPAGTELDLWQARAYVSVVGFLMKGTRVLGVPVPWHRDFEEVNLRFYVRRPDPTGWRRGVVFIKEIVPRRMIAWAARRLYNESYVAMPMRHHVALPGPASPGGTVPGGALRYEWYFADRWNVLSAEMTGEPAALVPGSEEEFITEHYWGYCRQRDGSTIEYRVEHPPWRVWTAAHARLDCETAALYGAEFVPVLQGQPTSAFIAEGSSVGVRRGLRIGG